MSATNLDLPVLISAEQIRRREFVTIRRGYDADQVRDYLEQLAGQVELMQSMLRDARLEAEAAIRSNTQPKIDPYEQLAARVAGVIREADAAAETIRSGARDDTERMTREARADADRIRTDAQARAEEARSEAEAAVHEARAEADRTISGLATRRSALVDQLASMQERLLVVAHDLERTIEIDGPEISMPEPPSSHASTPSEPEVATGAETEAGASDAPSAPADTRGEASPAAQDVIDVTDADEHPARPSGASEAAGTEALFAELDDPAYEELWEGTQAMRLEMPDIPPLDLDWGEDEDDLDDLRD